MANNFDVNLRLLLDEAALQRVKAGISTVDEELQKIGKSAADIDTSGIANEVEKVKRAVEAAGPITFDVELNERKKREYLADVQALYDEAKRLGIKNAGILDSVLSGTLQGTDATEAMGEVIIAVERAKRSKIAEAATAKNRTEDLESEGWVKIKREADEAGGAIEGVTKNYESLAEELHRLGMLPPVQIGGETVAEINARKKANDELYETYKKQREAMQAQGQDPWGVSQFGRPEIVQDAELDKYQAEVDALARAKELFGELGSDKRTIFEQKLRSLAGMEDTVEAVNLAIKQTQEELDGATQAAEEGAKAEGKKGEAAKNTKKEIREQATEQRRFAELAMRASSRLGMAGRGMMYGGMGILTAGFAEANRYVSSTKKQTEATEEWSRATAMLARNRERVDEILVQQSLPIMREIAKISGQVANYVERNPQIVQAAITAGKVLISIGGIAILASKGLRMVADASYVAATIKQNMAAKTMDGAADKMLVASGNMKGGGVVAGAKGLMGKFTGGVTAMAGTTGGVVTLAAITGAVAAGLATVLSGVADKLGDVVEKRFGRTAGGMVGGAANAVLQMNPITGPMTTSINALKKMFPQLQEFSDKHIGGLIDKLKDLGNKTDDAAESVNDLSNAAGDLNLSAARDQIVDAYKSWKEDEARMTREAETQRASIIKNAEQQILASAQQYAQQVAGINAQHNKARTDIVTTYQQDLIQMEEDYQTNRAEIIKAGNEDLQKMQEQHKEQLEKMEKEHNDRVAELTAARDALGLAKENRRYADDKSELSGDFKKEMAERKKETAQRLQELADQYAKERAQRYEKYQQDLLDNEAARQAELKQAQETHQRELEEIQRAKAEQLKELQDSLNAERIRRREQFIAQVRDLDAAMLGERNLKNNYYNAMLADANAWLTQYRAALASLGGTAPASSGGSSSSTSSGGSSGTSSGNIVSSTWQKLLDSWNSLVTRDAGGYVQRGVYKMAWDGKPEFVLNGPTTKAAEKLIGGNLTQENVMRALVGRGAQNNNSTNVEYNDHRRIDQPMSKWSKREYEDTARNVLVDILGA